MKNAILDLGMHRCGTKCSIKYIKYSRAYQEERLIPSSSNNAKGYFENEKLKVTNNNILFSQLNDATWENVTIQDIQKAHHGMFPNLNEIQLINLLN